MSFDFVSYLSVVDPLPPYNIERLSGGLINETVRASKLSKLSLQEGRFPGHESLVLKYAPPFIASLGEDFPFSQARQSIEARALSLFTARKPGFPGLQLNPAVLVPKLLTFDEAYHVLVISDMGNCLNLAQILGTRLVSSLSSASATSIGSQLGLFFARLHCPSTYATVWQHFYDKFSCNDKAARELVFNMTVKPVEERLRAYGYEDARELSRRIHTDFNEPLDTSAQSFVLGDAWPGAVLVEICEGEDPAVGVIDWEFAGFGSGLAGDVAQLLAHLHLYLLATSAILGVTLAIEALISNFTASYRKESKKLGCLWAVEGLDASAPNATTRAMRSAFLLMGREMVNNAVERDCSCSDCQERGAAQCATRVAMVQKGVWYLQRAQANDEDFCAQGSLADLLQAENVLKGLFEDF